VAEKKPSLKDRFKEINKVMPTLGLSKKVDYLKKLLEKRKKRK
jgi:hypothetical protein